MEKSLLDFFTAFLALVFSIVYLISAIYGSNISPLIEGVLALVFFLEVIGVWKHSDWSFGVGTSAVLYSAIINIAANYFGALKDSFQTALPFSKRIIIILALTLPFLVLLYIYEKERKLRRALGTG